MCVDAEEYLLTVFELHAFHRVLGVKTSVAEFHRDRRNIGNSIMVIYGNLI